MGANGLGQRKVKAIALATGLPIIRAMVWSHVDSGRTAVFVLADGRRGEIDRNTGEWHLYPDPGGTDDPRRTDGGMSDGKSPTTWHGLAPHIWTRIGGAISVMVRNDMPFSIIVGLADDGRIIATEGDRFSVRGPEDD